MSIISSREHCKLVTLTTGITEGWKEEQRSESGEEKLSCKRSLDTFEWPQTAGWQVDMFFGLLIPNKRQNKRSLCLLFLLNLPWPADLLSSFAPSTTSRCSAGALLPAPLELRAQPDPLRLDPPLQPAARLLQLQPGLCLSAGELPPGSCPPPPPSPSPPGSCSPLAGPCPAAPSNRVSGPETRPPSRPQPPRAPARLGLRAGARAQAGHRQPVHVALSSTHPGQPSHAPYSLRHQRPQWMYLRESF